MWLEINYKTAQKRYPKEVQEIIEKVRTSRSKNKNVSPELWAWGFSWCVRIEGMIGGNDFAQMIAGLKEFPKEKEPKSADEEVKDYARRAIVHLAGKISRAEWSSTDPVKFPDEIAQMIRKDFEKQQAEQARVDALSPEERDRETNEILRQLSGSPGFVALGVGPAHPMPRAIAAQGPDGPDDIMIRPLPTGGVGSILAKIKDMTKKR